MRAWLAILSERHPNVVWMPTPVERPGADGDKRWAIEKPGHSPTS
jgi:hypothetical protein